MGFQRHFREPATELARKNMAAHTVLAEREAYYDLSRHHEFMSKDIEYVNIPGGTPIVGLDAYIAGMTAFHKAISEFDSILEEQIATDTHVVARWRCKGFHTSALGDIPASGNFLNWTGVSMWEFENGKAVKGWMCSDNDTMLAQMRGEH